MLSVSLAKIKEYLSVVSSCVECIEDEIVDLEEMAEDKNMTEDDFKKEKEDSLCYILSHIDSMKCRLNNIRDEVLKEID